MKYEFLANATAITHFILVMAVIVGLLVSFRYKRFRPWEAAAVLIVLVFWSLYGNCPLTILESHFRDLAGAPVPGLIARGFLPYYINKFLNFNLPGPVIGRFTYFAGGVFFLASIEWMSPVFHFEVFRARKIWRNIFKKKARRYRRA